jgi:hypothetical protein
MKSNLVRISEGNSLPLKKSTLYKWKHLGKHPRLFVKLGGALFVDLDVLDELIEAGRLSYRKNQTSCVKECKVQSPIPDAA